MRMGISVAALFVSFLFAAILSAAEIPRPAEYPAKPVEIIVPYPAGGGLDACVRLVGKYAEAELGEKVAVANITSGGNIHGNYVGVTAAPDGYVLGAWGMGLVTDELMIRGVPYTHKDVKPLCMISDDPQVIVVSRKFAREKKIRKLSDLMDYARAHPGMVTLGVGGNWTSHDFLRLRMEAAGGVKFNRMPFLGGAPALKAAAEGNCDVVVPFLSESLPLYRRDQVVFLAVAYTERLSRIPEVPTTAEEGYPTVTQTMWRVLTAPLGTPEPVAAYLEAVFAGVLGDAAFKQEAADMGINPVFMGSRELKGFVEKEYGRYATLSEEWGIRVK